MTQVAVEPAPPPDAVDEPAAPRENVIEIEHLSKLYKDFWGRPKVRALDDLNLTIKKGEVFGLLGPNGSGKSTTIKLLLGLIFPTSGRASIFGLPIGSDAIKERIGFIPEESYFYKFLDGEETLRFYGKLFKLSRRELKERGADAARRRRPSTKRPASASSANTAREWPAASAWPKPSSTTPTSCCSTSRPPAWTPSARGR